MNIRIVELDDGRYLIEFEHRPDTLGPLTKEELLDLEEELTAWRTDEE